VIRLERRCGRLGDDDPGRGLLRVTTVGYGDVTLARTSGRIVAAFVMLQGLAFLAILVAAITSTFVASEEREQAEAREEESGEERIDARFDDLAARLDRLEGMIARLIGP
jgi:voltage-gated potassium channel